MPGRAPRPHSKLGVESWTFVVPLHVRRGLDSQNRGKRAGGVKRRKKHQVSAGPETLLFDRADKPIDTVRVRGGVRINPSEWVAVALDRAVDRDPVASSQVVAGLQAVASSGHRLEIDVEAVAFEVDGLDDGAADRGRHLEGRRAVVVQPEFPDGFAPVFDTSEIRIRLDDVGCVFFRGCGAGQGVGGSTCPILAEAVLGVRQRPLLGGVLFLFRERSRPRQSEWAHLQDGVTQRELRRS